MKNYQVTITETLKMTVDVEAESSEEAEAIVEEQWHLGEHILDADNFIGAEFKAKPKTRNKNHER